MKTNPINLPESGASIDRFVYWIDLLMIFFLAHSPKGMAQTVLDNCDEASLRSAVSRGGEIRFACNGTVHLKTALSVSTNATINASGYDVTLSGDDVTRIFVVTTNVTLELMQLTLAHGHDDGTQRGRESSSASGGAIVNEGGRIIIRGCQFLQNKATEGKGPSKTKLYIRGEGLFAPTRRERRAYPQWV